jgi:hypothetical protein
MLPGGNISILGTYSQIEDTVIQTSVECDTGELGIFLFHFRFGSGSIFQRERKALLSLSNNMKLLDHQLSIRDSAALDFLGRLCNFSLNKDDGFNRNAITDVLMPEFNAQYRETTTHEAPYLDICLLILSASVARIPWMVETP